MLPSFKTHRRHSIAALVLFVWLATLFINVAQACLSAPAPTHIAYAGTPVDAIEHEACVNEHAGHHPDVCKPHCDGQTRDIVKAKSFDPAGMDRPVRFSHLSFSPWNPDGGIVVSAVAGYSLLYDPNISLRFVRLTL